MYVIIDKKEERNMKRKNFAVSWAVVGLVLLVGIFSYAFYCTSRGMSFGWDVKFNRPRVGLMSVKCYR